MSLTDQVSDFITCIRNGVRVRKDFVITENTKMLRSIAEILKNEGFINGFEVISDDRKHRGAKLTRLKVMLKYVDSMKRVSPLRVIQRISTPGRRIYANHDRIPSSLNCLGITILTTSSGLMSDKEARRRGIGGEVMVKVY